MSFINDFSSILKIATRQVFLFDAFKVSIGETGDKTKKLRKEVNSLNKEINWLKKTLIEGEYSSKFDEVREKILNDIEKEVADSALNKAKIEIENSESITEKIITKKINELIQTKINDFDISKHVDDVRRQHAITEKMRRERELDTFIDNQLRAGGFLRTVLINLFIIANFSIIAFLFLQSGEGIGKEVLLFISGLYVSLSLFIVYIYRSSNLRAKALMALKEDSKRFYDAIYYLDTFGDKEELKSNHENIITTMLANRLENEVTPSHPYEKIVNKIIDKIPNK